MPPIILWLLQGVFLLLLYVFVWRAVRAVVRDLRTAAPAPRPPRQRRMAPQPAAVPPEARRAAPSQLVVHFPDGRPQVIELSGSPVLFGRSPSCTVRLEDPYVSDDHARISRANSGWLIEDLGSTNGVTVNGASVEREYLSGGEDIELGNVRMRFLADA